MKTNLIENIDTLETANGKKKKEPFWRGLKKYQRKTR